MSAVSGRAGGRDDLLGQLGGPAAPLAEDVGRGAGDAPALAEGVDQGVLLGRVGRELVDGHDVGLPKCCGAVEVGGQVVQPSLDGRRRWAPWSASSGTPPCILRARIVATITTAAGFRPAERHLRSKNFSPPRSNANPASVTA